MRAINLKVGDVIVYMGNERTRVDITRKPIATIRRGDEMIVVEVHPPRRGMGVFFDADGDEVDDQDRDGHATVVHAEWGRLLAWPGDENNEHTGGWRRKTFAPSRKGQHASRSGDADEDRIEGWNDYVAVVPGFGKEGK